MVGSRFQSLGAAQLNDLSARVFLVLIFGRVNKAAYIVIVSPNCESSLRRTAKRGHIVADTLLLMTFPCARKLGNICCGHKMFLNKIRNIFVSRTQNLCPQQMLRERENGETFVSATMCPQQCVLVCQYLMIFNLAKPAFFR